MNIVTSLTPYGRFSYWPSDGIGNSIAQGNAWDEWFLEEFDKCTPYSTVIDVGANIGFFTVYAARRGCKVYSFEPCREVFGLLKRNVEQNHLQEFVSMFPLALYERCELLSCQPLKKDNPANQLFDGDDLNTNICTNSGSLELGTKETGVLPQYSVPLDFFQFQYLALIKTDTEGLDLEVLKGAENTIRLHRPTLCYEYRGPDTKVDTSRLDQFNSYMAALDYVPQVVHSGMNDCYHDFVAKPKEKL